MFNRCSSVASSAPKECVSDETKEKIRNECFEQHEKLQTQLVKCFGSDRTCEEKNEERSMSCVMMAAKQDPQMVPIQLHDCVDEIVTMKHWKCIRRAFMERMKSMMELVRGKKLFGGSHAGNLTVGDM